jgi:alkylhydroperoxidase family enzyme
MSYIAVGSGQYYPWYVRLILALQRRRYGSELEPARLWGLTPRVFAAQTLLYRALERKSSPLEPALRALVMVRVSQINWCEFCVDLNSANAIQRHVPTAKLDALSDFENSVLYSERERAALAYADAMTDSNRKPNAKMIELLRQHFHDDAIIELTALIAFQNLSSKFNAALGVQAQGFCRSGERAGGSASMKAEPVTGKGPA